MGTTGGELVDAVRGSTRRRYRAQAAALALRLLASTILVAALAIAGMQLGLLAGSLWVLMPAALLGLSIPLAALVMMCRPVNELAEAKRLDDTLGLKDRLTSALSFLSHTDPTRLQHATVIDARRFLPEVYRHRGTGVGLRKPLIGLLVVALVALGLTGGAQTVCLLAGLGADRTVAAGDTPTPHRPDRTGPSEGEPGATEPETSEEGLEEVEDTKLTDDTSESVFNAAETAELAALAASETSEADRLLAQAAYLDESELDDSGLDSDGSGGDQERVMMKEPDMDMIREIIKEAQKRKKERKDEDQGDENINLEVLIKTHSTASAGAPKRQSGRRSSGGASGPSQDTRIKPRRVNVKDKVAFKIVSVRSLTPSSASGAKRIVLSEAAMRASGAPETPLVETRPVTVPAPGAEPKPVAGQTVPPELRAYVSKYFEGLQQLMKSPKP